MKIFFGIILIICLFLSFGCEEEQTNLLPPTGTMANTPASTVVAPYISTTTAVIQTFEPIILTGTSSKSTAPFTIPSDEWIIEWEYTPDLEYPDLSVFSFSVFPRGENLFDVETIFMGDTPGSTYIYAGPGDFYLDVTIANIPEWTITIKPPQ